MMHIFSLVQNALQFLAAKDRVYLTVSDSTQYASEQELAEKYRLYMTHFPLEILYLGSKLHRGDEGSVAGEETLLQRTRQCGWRGEGLRR